MNSIFVRRSVRKYKPDPVSDAELKQCLNAAMHAPSAGNEQAWEFIITSSKDGLHRLSQAHPYGKMLPEAPLAVTICGNRNKLKFPQEYWIEDCSAAAQNFMLQATEFGLGTVWLAVYPCEDRMEAVGRELKLPEHIIPLCIIPLGYPGEAPSTDTRFKPEKIHQESWKPQEG